MLYLKLWSQQRPIKLHTPPKNWQLYFLVTGEINHALLRPFIVINNRNLLDSRSYEIGFSYIETDVLTKNFMMVILFAQIDEEGNRKKCSMRLWIITFWVMLNPNMRRLFITQNGPRIKIHYERLVNMRPLQHHNWLKVQLFVGKHIILK